jgi:hypothetical protein
MKNNSTARFGHELLRPQLHFSLSLFLVFGRKLCCPNRIPYDNNNKEKKEVKQPERKKKK